MVVYNRSGKRMELQNTLGTGGEGTVYRVNARVCAKIYTKPTAFKEEKIKTMIAKPPVPLTDPACKNGRVAWPMDTLYDRPGGYFVGYLMPLIEIRKYQESEMVFIEKLRTKKFGQRFTYQHLMTAAYNFAMTVHYIHQAGHSVGDLREKNILVDSNGQVCLVDCDSFQIMDEAKKRFFASETYTPAYLAPEWIGKDLSKANRRGNDHFALAVWIFQMLMNGMHPYQARGGKADQSPSLEEKIKKGTYPYGRVRGLKPPVAAPDFHQVPASLRLLFEASFIKGQKDASLRPQALVYANSLKQEIGKLKTCRSNRNHRFSGDLSSCPFCQGKKQPAKPHSVKPRSVGGGPVRPKGIIPKPRGRRGRPAIGLPKLARLALFMLIFMGLFNHFAEGREPLYTATAAGRKESAPADLPRAESLGLEDFYLWYTGGVLYVNQWDESHFKEDLRIKGVVRESGIGTYIPPSQTNHGDHIMTVEMNAEGSGPVNIVFGAESWWCYGPEFGSYCMAFFVNEEMVLVSDWMDYTGSGDLQLDLNEGDLLTILIREKAGSKGTLNPVIAFED